MGKESYCHFYAKEILRSWLVQAYKRNDKMGYPNKFYIFEWEIDKRMTDCGIKLEYPLLTSTLANGTTEYLGLTTWTKYPDLDKLSDNVRVEAVFDLVICENNRIKYIIEIVHKHICSQAKRDLLATLDIPAYEISAEWILSQLVDQRPTRLPLVEILSEKPSEITKTKITPRITPRT